MIWRWLPLWIALVSFLVVPNVGDSFWRPKEVVFLLGGLLLLGMPGRTFQHFSNWFVPWCYAWVLGQFAWFFLKPIAFVGTDFKVHFAWWTLLPTLDVLVAFLLMDRLVRSTDSLQRWIRIAQVLCGVAILYALYGLGQSFGLDQFTYARTNGSFLNTGRSPSFNGNTMVSMGLLGILTPIFLMFKPWYFKVGYGLCLLTLARSHAAMGVVGAILGTLVFLLLRRQWRVSILLSLFIGLLGYYVLQHSPSYFAITDRPLLWQHTLTAWKERPYTGFGLGGFANRFAYVKQPDLYGPAHAAHNDYLEGLMEFGVIGMGCFLLAFGSTLVRVWRYRITPLVAGLLASLASYSIVAFFGFPLRIASSALIFLLIWIACEAVIATGGVNAQSA